MMKLFCDGCGEEITRERLPPKSALFLDSAMGGMARTKISYAQTFFVGVYVSACEGQRNVGDFCKYCVIDAVCALDDRPKLETKYEPPQPQSPSRQF